MDESQSREVDVSNDVNSKDIKGRAQADFSQFQGNGKAMNTQTQQSPMNPWEIMYQGVDELEQNNFAHASEEDAYEAACRELEQWRQNQSAVSKYTL